MINSQKQRLLTLHNAALEQQRNCTRTFEHLFHYTKMKKHFVLHLSYQMVIKPKASDLVRNLRLRPPTSYAHTTHLNRATRQQRTSLP